MEPSVTIATSLIYIYLCFIEIVREEIKAQLTSTVKAMCQAHGKVCVPGLPGVPGPSGEKGEKGSEGMVGVKGEQGIQSSPVICVTHRLSGAGLGLIYSAGSCAVYSVY